jgi:hypothetical protein
MLAQMHLGGGLALKYEDLVEDLPFMLMQLIDYLHANFTEEVSLDVPLLSRQEMIKNKEELLQNYHYHRNLCLNLHRTHGHLAATSTDTSTNLHYYTQNIDKKVIKFITAVVEDFPSYFHSSAFPAAAAELYPDDSADFWEPCQEGVDKYLSCYNIEGAS